MKSIQKKTILNLSLLFVLITLIYISWKYNNKLFFLVNGFYKDVLAYPMIFLTAMADGLFVLMIAAAAYQKKRGYFWSFITAFIISSIIVQLIKNYFVSGRPLSYYPIDQIYYAGEILKAQSFPSGHSAVALVLTRYLAQGTGKKLMVFIYTLGILAALSRVYIGVHFPKDITSGAVLGFLIASMVFYFAERKYKHSNRAEYRYNNLLISLTGLISGVFYLFFNSDLYEPLSYFVNITAVLFCLYFTWKVIFEFFKIYRGDQTPA